MTATKCLPSHLTNLISFQNPVQFEDIKLAIRGDTIRRLGTLSSGCLGAYNHKIMQSFGLAQLTCSNLNKSQEID